MSSRSILRETIRVQVGAAMAMAMAVVGVTGWAREARAGTAVVEDTKHELTDAEAFVGGVLPAYGVDVVQFGGELTGQTNTAYTWLLGDASTGNTWGGIQVLNPGGDIVLEDPVNGLNLGSGGIDMGAAARGLTLDLELGLVGNQTWNVAAGRTLTVTGAVVPGSTALTITGAGATVVGMGFVGGSAMSLTKQGAGRLTVSGQSTYTGATTVSNGTLALVFGGGVTADVLRGGGSVALGGGLTITGGGTQTLGLLTGVAGPGTIQVASGNGLVVAGKTRNLGASLAIMPDGGGSNVVFSSDINSALITEQTGNGGDTAWVTYGLNDWAATDGSGNVVAASYQASGTTAIGGNTYSNIDVTGGFLMGAASAITINSFRFNDPANAYVLTVNGSTRTIVTKGILVGAQALGGTITAGNLRAKSGYLPIVQNSTNGDLTIGSTLANNGTTKIGLVKSGAGRLILTSASNVIGSGVFLNEGIVQPTVAGALGSGSLTFGGGTLQLGSLNVTLLGMVNERGGSVEVMAGGAATMSGVIGGAGLLTKTGPGTLTLANVSNAYGGGTAIDAGTMLVSAGGGTPLGSGAVNINSTGTSGGVMVVAGSFGGSNAINVNAGGELTVTGNLSSAFAVNDGGAYRVNTGTVSGAVSVFAGGMVTGTGTTLGATVMGSGAILEPGERLAASVVDFRDLTLGGGAVLNMTVAGGGSAVDEIRMVPGGTLTLGMGIEVNLYDGDTGSPFVAGGSYPLFSGVNVIDGGRFVGSATEGVLTNFVLGSAGGGGGVSAVFSIVGGNETSSIWVTLAAGPTVSQWTGGVGSMWASAGNWSAGVPGGTAGDEAALTGTLAVPGVVDLGDTSERLGRLGMDSGAQGGAWTVTGGAGRLIMDNGTSGAALIEVGVGCHLIGVDVDLVSSTVVNFNSTGGALTISGVVRMDGSSGMLTVGGNGGAALILTGANAIAGTTNIVAGGILQIGNGGTTGAVGAGAIVDNGMLRYARTDATTLANNITGAGGVAVMSGSLTLSNYHATGAIDVGAGQLALSETSGARQTSAIVVVTNSLAITNNGSALDISNHDLMSTNNNPASAANVETWVNNGMAVLLGLGDPNGPQITSSSVIAHSLDAYPTYLVKIDFDYAFGGGTTGDGSAVGASYGGYSTNMTIDQPGTLMVKYGYFGDLDFSGVIDVGDVNLMLGSLNSSTPGITDVGLSYLYGDLDASGMVDAGDVNLLLGYLGAGSGGGFGDPLGGLELPSFTSGGGGSTSAVPEPASLMLVGLGALGLVGRRKQGGVWKRTARP